MMDAEKEPIRHDRTKESYRAYRNALCRKAQRKRRELARKNGLCSICCKNPARPERLTCQTCTDRATGRYEKSILRMVKSKR